MNPPDLERQIKKFYIRRRKARLATVCAVIATFLTLSTLGSGISFTTAVAFFLLLPLPTYFVSQSLKLYRKTLSRPVLVDPAPSTFSISHFFTQPGLAFRFSLLLFLLICVTTLARARQIEPPPTTTTISHQPLTLPAQAGISR